MTTTRDGACADLASVIERAQASSSAARMAQDARLEASCGEGSQARDEARQEAARARQSAQRESSLKTIPTRLQWARFGGQWDGRVDDRAIAELERMGGAKGRGANPLLTLHGPPRSGKTSAAAALFRARLEVAQHPVGLFVTAYDLVAATKATPLGQDVELVERAKRVPMLVLDDVGQEPSGEWNRVVVEVVHARHAQQLWTVLTTYYDLSTGAKDIVALEARYGGGMAGRVVECRHVAFRGRAKR